MSVRSVFLGTRIIVQALKVMGTKVEEQRRTSASAKGRSSGPLRALEGGPVSSNSVLLSRGALERDEARLERALREFLT